MSLLYGVHDREGRHIVPPGGWVVDTVALSENPAPTDYAALRGDINWIVRLNWGYGSTGTIPLANDYDEFAARCAAYVHQSRGARIWIIGNEPNHENERPNGVYIAPGHYVECFVRCRDAIKRADPSAQVLPAPCAPYHASPMPWTDYWYAMLKIIANNGGCDGIAIHAYTRSSDPRDIRSDALMGPPLEHTYSGFRTYLNALDLVPESMRHLPVYITEFNELLDDGWHDANTGVVQAAYGEIDNHNQRNSQLMIHCLALYRWPKFDKWHIEGKQGVIDDFRAAVARGYKSPQKSVEKLTNQDHTYMPSVSSGTAQPTIQRDIDPRASQRGVSIAEITPPTGPAWRAVRVQWLDEQQSQGRHHIYADVLDEQGNRVAGVPLLVTWPSGNTRIVTEAKPGEPYAANFPMSPSRNEFAVAVVDGTPSEMVRGIGMGAETPGGFNAGIHTSTVVVFQRVNVPAATQPAPSPKPQQPAAVPVLAHPIADPAKRIISQRFGENPADYAQFGMAGHTGIDYAVPVGTPVCAVDDGKVIQASYMQDYGNVIKLQHVWGESVYAHLDGFQMVTVGETVGRGDVIAISGNTGNSTGPHLHFAIRIFPYQRGGDYDGFTDPEPYLSEPGTPQTHPITHASILALIKIAAANFGLDWRLVASLAWAESSFNPRAQSKAGAKGLMQIMDSTWQEWAPRVGASDIFSPEHNVAVGCAYLAWLLRQTNGNVYKALHAYVWGIGNVLSNEPPPDEVICYAAKIVHGRDFSEAIG